MNPSIIQSFLLEAVLLDRRKTDEALLVILKEAFLGYASLLLPAAVVVDSPLLVRTLDDSKPKPGTLRVKSKRLRPIEVGVLWEEEEEEEEEDDAAARGDGGS